MYGLAGRLEHATGPYGDLGWAYDPVGNRIYESTVSGSTAIDAMTSIEAASNRIADVTSNGTVTRTFTHDAAGNLTVDDRAGTAYTYAYNARGRLSGLTIGSTPTAAYVYDALERLAIRTTQNLTPAGTTHYVYDLAGHLIAESAASGAVLREYIWLDDVPLAVVADLDTATPHLWFVHADHLDRPIKMTGAARAVVWDAVYKPFGEIHAVTGSASTNLRFPGQYFLIESGLHYNWHRHYDPTLGRYIQPDPLEFVDGPSVYSYASSAPAIHIDPTGQRSHNGTESGAESKNEICEFIQAAAKKSPPFICVNCGAPHGGLYNPYCPDCWKKSLDPKGGVAPVPKIIDPRQYMNDKK